MKDRFTKGLIAGLIGGIAMNLIDYIFFYLFNFSKERLLDFGAETIFGHRASTLIETVIAQSGQLMFAGLTGVIFAYLITYIKSSHYLLKGWFYGVVSWFLIYALGRLFKVLEDVPWQNAIAHFIAASVFGLVLVQTLKWLDITRKNLY